MGKREENQLECRVGECGLTHSAPLLTAPSPRDPAAPGGAHGASALHQPGVRGADGALLPEGAGGAPAEVEGLRAGRRPGGAAGPRGNRGRRDEREEKGRMGRGASVGITGSAGLSAQQGALIQPCSVCRVALSAPPTSFQQRVERFHENPAVRELPLDTYMSRTINLVNCGPPLR